LEFAAGGDYAKLLDDWVEYGIEWRMGSQFNLSVATHLGRDLHENIFLYPLNTIKNQENTYIRRDIRTKLFLEDGNGGVASISDPTAVNDWGVRELYQVFSDAVGEGTSTAQGYALMGLIKDQVVERRVKIDPFVDGRRPFVDFDIGDTVTVVFGPGARFEFRVLAIALEVDENNQLTAEVTLDFMLEAQRKRRQKLLQGQGGDGGVSSGAQLIYAESSGSIFVNTTPTTLCSLAIKAFVATYGKVGLTITANYSTNTTMRFDLVYDSVIVKSWYDPIPGAGLATSSLTWLWLDIPEGEQPVWLQARVAAGSMTLSSPGDAQLWVEAKGIAGFTNSTPSIIVEDFVSDEVYTVTDAVSFSSDSVPGGIILGETVDEFPYAVSDDTWDADEVIFSESYTSTGTADGYTTPTTLVTNSQTNFMGNIGGEARNGFFRFAIPTDYTSLQLVKAELLLYAHTTITLNPQVELRAEDASAPTTITSVADYNSRTLTTASIALGGTITAGTTRAIDVTAIVEELFLSYTSPTYMQFMGANNSSPTAAYYEWRTGEHPNGPPPTLKLYYRIP